MANHGARDHATWSASATARNWTCSGALALALRNPSAEIESQAAAWGTACHQVSEKCLRGNFDADTLIGSVEKTKQHEIDVDEELAETAQVYIDYVRTQHREAENQRTPLIPNILPLLKIEQHFSLSVLAPPFDAGGTADALLFYPLAREIEVVDLKGGRGLVEAADNKQLRTYALGAMLANPGLDVLKVKVTIVQPRAPHKDGRIRSEDFHVADLMEWTAELLARMRLSKQAIDEFDTMPFAAWWSKWLTPGNCKFCPSEGNCPALERKALDAVGVWFNDESQAQISNAPDSGAPEEIAASLDALDMIQDWINARRAYAHQQAELGVKIPNYVLVAKQGREKWNEGAEDMVLTAVAAAKLAPEKYQNPPKLKTPKQVRKALSKANEKLVAGLSFTPSEGTNLVRADKTTREAVAAPVSNFFTAIPD